MSKATRFFISLLFYSLTGLGISMTIAAGIGVSSFNAMNVALAAALQTNVGLITILVNFAFTAAYILLTGFRHPTAYALQIVAVLCLGKVIDFFTYGVFAGHAPQDYVSAVALLVAGTLVAGFSTGMVLNLKSITFPMENTCVEIGRKTGISFAKLRYGVDIFSVVVSVAISVLYKLPLFAREGTLISLFILTATISATKGAYDKLTQSQQP